MEPDIPLHSSPAATGKKRIPKACSSCRQSKVRCDGKRPCSRCGNLGKECIFFEVPKDATAERLESLEREVQRLNEQLLMIQQSIRKPQFTEAGPSQTSTGITSHPTRMSSIEQSLTPACGDGSALGRTSPSASQKSPGGEVGDVGIENSLMAHSYRSQPSQPRNPISIQSLLQPDFGSPPLRKRPRSEFELQGEPISDIIAKGLVTTEQAMFYFNTFFQGCDRYIPIFDPRCDTFDSVRSRSSILLNAICTIGCRVANERNSRTSDILNAELKRWINVVILDPMLKSLESVQAMLVVACYSTERSLILSFATRMALELKLPDSYEELIQKLSVQDVQDLESSQPSGGSMERSEETLLMRKSRIWFGLLVLEHIFRVDAGKLPGIQSKGNTRRCRLLLNHPSSTPLDLRLLAQAELNVLRAQLNDKLNNSISQTGVAISEFVQDAKIDLDIWFMDWSQAIESSTIVGDERPFLLINLRIQKCWAEMMVQCKAMKRMGVENVAAMSTTESAILLMAKNSAKRHLKLVSTNSDYYLSTFKYAMDFVWAKCAFCFLLLLKLTQLVPESEEDSQQLLEGGNRLLQELSRAGCNGGSGSGNGNIYLQILKLSIEKYRRVLKEHEPQAGNSGAAPTSPFWETFNAQTDLQSFVPEQFIFEWDFPGLNLFYFPTTWQEFFGDFALNI